ncbi:MAG: hypothetical protein ACQEQ4_11225 [Fibrobacterota bacterium]
MNPRTKIFLYIVLLFSISSAAGIAGLMNTQGHSGISRTLSTAPLGKNGMHGGGSFKLDIAPEGIRINGENERVILLSQSLFFGYGITPLVDVGVNLPFYQDFWDRWEEDRGGVGDLSLGLKVAHPGFTETAPFTLAYYLGAGMPTGSSDKGVFQRHSYYTNNDSAGGNQAFTGEAWRLSPAVIWTIDMTRFDEPRPLRIHGNLGASAAAKTPDKNNLYNQYSAAVGAVGLEFLAQDNMTLFTELSGEFRVGYFVEGFTITDFNNDRLIFSLGGQRDFSNGMYINGAADIGVSSRQHRTPWEKTTADSEQLVYETRPVPAIGFNMTLGFSTPAPKASDRMVPSPVAGETKDVTEKSEAPDADDQAALQDESPADTAESIQEETAAEPEEAVTQEPMVPVVVSQGQTVVLALEDIQSEGAEFNDKISAIAADLGAHEDVSIEIMAIREGAGEQEPAEWAKTVARAIVAEGIVPDRLSLKTGTVRDSENSDEINHRVEITGK